METTEIKEVESPAVALSRAICRRIHRHRERFGELLLNFTTDKGENFMFSLAAQGKLRTRVYIKDNINYLAIRLGSGRSTLIPLADLIRLTIIDRANSITTLTYERCTDGIFRTKHN